MVNFEGDERSRAQLILVGAVAIAFIVMGLVVVFNTVLYTENVASTGSVSEPREAQRMNQVIRTGTKGMVAGVNADVKWNDSASSDDGDARDPVLANLSTYSEGLLNVTADRRPGFVSVTEGDSSRMLYAARLADAGGDNFTDTNDAADWEVTDGSGAVYREFAVNVTIGSLENEGSGNEFHLVWNETGAAENYSVWVYEDGSGDVAIKTLATGPSDSHDPQDFSASAAQECVLSGSGSATNVSIDFTEGTVENYDCPNLDLRSRISEDEYSTLRFGNGDGASGEYAVVVWRNEPDPTGYMTTVGVKQPGTIGDATAELLANEQPYWSYAVWEMELETTYESSETTFTDTYVIEVYNSTA